MLTLLLGTDWVVNRADVLNQIACDVKAEKPGRILMVPELISHDTERRLCSAAGDTASRFAEVLSFTRLYRRVCDEAGFGAEACLDNGGRIVAMAAAARQLHSKLKAYAAVETRPEFLSGLIEAVDEFKRCCISPEDLAFASRQTEGVLAQKLEELALLLETYDAICQQGKRDPSDQMTWLLEQLEGSDFAANHVFYIDGFPDFTRQHMAILEHLVENSPQVVVSLNCDVIASKNPAFEKAGATASELYQFAKRIETPVKIIQITERDDPLSYMREKLFHGRISLQPQLGNRVSLHRSDSIYGECLAAAETIMDLVQSGVRYRQISVVCADMPAYQSAVNMVFQRCRIPAYQSGTEDILEKPVINTVLSAMDASLGGFERRDVIRYLKSMLSPLSLSVSDRIENYAILWNITGSCWLENWVNHPMGLEENWTAKDEEMLEDLNAARVRLMDPLVHLRDGILKAGNIRQQVRALYAFFEEIELNGHLRNLAEQMENAGDHRNAQILDQLWDILLTALEQLYDILGDSAWDAETFTRLFRLLLSQYDVGTIPPVLDAVMIGPVSAMRCQEPRHLLVLGALEGCLPGYTGSTGILTDQERDALRHLGVPLTGGGVDGIQAEFAEIYGVFCGATEGVHVFCPPGQPSFLYRRLLDMAGKETAVDVSLGAARADALEAGAFLARNHGEEFVQLLSLEESYARIENSRKHTLGSIGKENVRKLYGERLNLSASQVDRQADCRLSYFLKYGLSARERKTVTVDPAEFGTYVHAVLEETAREVMELGGFREVSLEKALQIAGEYSAAYAQERFSQIDSERIQYLFNRNKQELDLIVTELWQELRDSAFVPVGFEVSFGGDEPMDAIPIPGHSMDAQLRGFVDRVDAWQENGQNYFRVVDYKTGKKDFDYCDVFNGYGLQMLLYLFALEDAGEPVLGASPVPVGVQYFPARVPLLSADGVLTEEEAAAAREKAWKRKGLLLSDAEVLSAMESAEKPLRLNYTVKKDGTLSGDLADRQQFRLLKAYVFTLLGKMVDDIASGCVDPNPYTRGSSHNACAFCPYGSVCHREDVAGRRNYKMMTPQRFWDEVEKEMNKHG